MDILPLLWQLTQGVLGGAATALGAWAARKLLKGTRPMGEQKAAEPLIDAKEVARRLGVKFKTVLAWAGAGKIPCLRAGPKTVRFDWQKVRAALGAGEGK